ncbi:MAG TPA: hypothetical protein PLR71_13735 [Deltaproteobacteria bacterium]|nr:hypothetical protein [Deltaproteobacteria bacterium]
MPLHSLLHEAYLTTRHGMDDKTARERLHGLFPHARQDLIHLALTMAWELRDVAFSVTVRMRSGIIGQDEAMDELRRRCPGFSDMTYAKAWAFGLCESSW